MFVCPFAAGAVNPLATVVTAAAGSGAHGVPLSMILWQYPQRVSQTSTIGDFGSSVTRRSPVVLLYWSRRQPR